MRRNTNVGHILAYRLCPAYYHWLLTRGKQETPKESEITGRIVHRRAAEGNAESAIRFQQSQLALVPTEKRAEVAEVIEELAVHAQELSDPELTIADKEVQLSWLDPETGWTVYARPDEKFWFNDPLSNRVMQITEVKSKALWAKRYHKDQIFLFGLIASLAEGYEGPIRLLLRFPYVAKLKSEGVETLTLIDSIGERVINVDELSVEFERWYSPKMTEEKVRELRQDLLAMESGWSARKFECRDGDDCWACHNLGEHAPEREEPRIVLCPAGEPVPQAVVAEIAKGSTCGPECTDLEDKTA